MERLPLIVITKANNGISIKGHANYAPIGKDIVCSGVSALIQTLIQSVEELTTDKIEYIMSPGSVDIKYRNLSESAQLLVNSFFVGIGLIADTYPNHVSLTEL